MYNDLIKYLIASNFKDKKLNIHMACLNNKDYTKILTSFITRENCLYIPNPNFELNLRAKPGFMYIIYSYNNEPARISVFKLEGFNPVLLTWTPYDRQNIKGLPKEVMAIFVDEFDKTEVAASYIEQNFAFNIYHFDITNASQ